MESVQSPRKVVEFPSRGARGSAAELLGRVRARAATQLAAVLAAVLGKVDDTLFDFVQTAAVGTDHQDYLDAMRELRLRRSAVEAAAQQHLVRCFDALAAGNPVSMESALTGAAPGELALVSEEELEEQLGAKMVAQTVQREYAAVLAQLDRRLGHLAGELALDESSNPIGAGQLGALILVGLRGCKITPRVKLIVFKLYERELLPAAATLLDEVNRELVAAGVLPELKLAPVRRHDPVEKKAAPAEAVQEAEEAAQPRPSGAVSASEQALFSTLHDLLRAYRNATFGAAAPATEASRPLSSEETLSVLQHLQNALPDSVRRAIEDPSQSLAQRLKQEMLQGAGRVGVDPRQASLNPMDEDAIDLVGMLFEVLLDERDLERAVRDTIGRLVVPFIKVAMLDKRMFMQRTHPARRLLNSLAEACEGNRGETPQERALLDKVREVVDRLLAEFNENVAIFETLEEEFRAFTDQHRRRIELAERRAAEAQRGRERLEQARALADAEIAARVAGRQVPPTVESVLQRYWGHHLTVTALRDGNDSEKYRSAVAAGNAVIGALDAALVGETLLLPALAPMRAALLQILATSGCVGDAAKEVIRAVAEEMRGLSRGESSHAVAPAVAAAEPPSLRPEAPRSAGEGSVFNLGLSSNPEDLDFDPADAERIAQLAVGSWVEFTGEDGAAQPAKLSWVSPISRRLLFVNRRGVRFCVASAAELAAMMREGRLAIRHVDTAFEHAMHQVLGKLGAGEEGLTLTPEQFAA